MANLAVKLFANVSVGEKPAGIPDSYPAEIIELGESTTLPEEGVWQLMTEQEYSDYMSEVQAEYDAWVAANELTAAKATRAALLQDAVNTFLDSYYPFLVRVQMMNIFTLAMFDSKTNRAAYLRTGIDWFLSVTVYALNRAAFINSRTTIEDVNAVTWDIGGNVSAAPSLTVGAALTISD